MSELLRTAVSVSGLSVTGMKSVSKVYMNNVKLILFSELSKRMFLFLEGNHCLQFTLKILLKGGFERQMDH